MLRWRKTHSILRSKCFDLYLLPQAPHPGHTKADWTAQPPPRTAICPQNEQLPFHWFRIPDPIQHCVLPCQSPTISSLRPQAPQQDPTKDYWRPQPPQNTNKSPQNRLFPFALIQHNRHLHILFSTAICPVKDLLRPVWCLRRFPWTIIRTLGDPNHPKRKTFGSETIVASYDDKSLNLVPVLS